MSSAVAPVRRLRKVLVYNPTHLADVVQAYGAFYTFPPMGVGKCGCAEHNVAGREDNEGVHSVLDYERDEKTLHLQTQAPKKVGGGGDLTADRVAEFIVSDACRGGKHFVILEGTEPEIEELKRKAEESYVGVHLEAVAATIEAWESECAQARMANVTTPKMRKNVAEAYAFRKRHREKVAVRAEFVCGFCGYETDVRKDFDTHVRDEHPQAAARLQPPPEGHDRPAEPLPTATGNEGPPAGVPVPAPAPRKAPAGSGKKLIARAEAVGIVLTVADRKGLEFDDLDVFEDVETRIAQQKADAKKARANRAPAAAGAEAEE